MCAQLSMLNELDESIPPSATKYCNILTNFAYKSSDEPYFINDCSDLWMEKSVASAVTM